MAEKITREELVTVAAMLAPGLRRLADVGKQCGDTEWLRFSISFKFKDGAMMAASPYLTLAPGPIAVGTVVETDLG